MSNEMEIESKPLPRWSQTPTAMKAPVSSKPKLAGRKQLQVNDSPQKLDQFYTRFLNSPDILLSDETKWLAVTHKSFDFGRRGYNDRLAFFGKRILSLQASLSLLRYSPNAYLKNEADSEERKPFEHEDLTGLLNLSGQGKEFLLHHTQISKVAESYGLQEVIRWQPKDTENLGASGYSMVMAQSIFAIIGALAHEHGKEVADNIANTRVLAKVRALPR